MIEGVFAIGKLQPQQNFLEEFIEDVGERNKHIFKIIVDITGEYPQYKKIEYEEYDSNKKMKYFYKRGASTTPDKTPTSKITEIDKTFNTKIKKTFLSFLNSNANNLNEEEKVFLQKMQNMIDRELNNMKNDLKDKAKQLGILRNNKIDGNGVITFVFKDDSNYNYLGDMHIFRNTFLKNENEAYKDFYCKFNKISKDKNKYCYICKKESDEVWGFVNTYNFYTADKECYVAGGFKQELMWKNYPVCSDCAKILERGKRYVDKKLSYKFCGFNYLLVPQLLIDDEEFLKKLLKTLEKYKDFSLAEKKSALIEKVEERTLRELGKVNNQINFNFLFYEKSNSAFKILLYLREIAPTRLKFLIDSKDKVDNFKRKFNIFQEIKTKREVVDFNFSFSFIRDFFPKKDGNIVFDNYFLSIVNNIFIGKNISMDFIMGRFMEKIRSEFLNDNWIEPWVLKSYKILIYLEEINLLDRRRNIMRNYENHYEEFFRENQIFDDEVKKALFLEGVLAQKLLNIQYQERQSTPFRSRLNGLKIDERVAKRLLPEMINKLDEYNKNYYRELEEKIGEYMVNASFKKYSVDELSYYFTLGMVLSKYFKFDREENNQE